MKPKCRAIFAGKRCRRNSTVVFEQRLSASRIGMSITSDVALCERCCQWAELMATKTERILKQAQR